MTRYARWSISIGLAVAAIGLIGWSAASIGDLHDRLSRHSRPLAAVIAAAAACTAIGVGAGAARVMWRIGRDPNKRIEAPQDVIKAAELQTEAAVGLIEQVKNEATRGRLQAELNALHADRNRKEFHVVIFGTGSAGKTSLVSALLGHAAGTIEPTMGTTRTVERHTQRIDGLEGTVFLTDTPGLAEIGAGGDRREAEARDLAVRADLLIFVLDHDLIRSEFEPLTALLRKGKRSIVALNKTDRFVESDRDAILSKLRERLEGLIDPRDIVAIAANPRPTVTRVRSADGSERVEVETEEPQIERLQERIAAILDREGESLRAANLLLRAHLLTQESKRQLTIERRRRAQEVIDKYQWITAGTVFVNPLPAFDLMATGAVQFQMISEIAGAFAVELEPRHAKMIGSQMIQMLLKLGMVEAATSLIAGFVKSTLVGHVAGGAVQAASMAYLTRISGLAFLEYFAAGQSWGDGGLQAALIRQFDLTSRGEFLQEFARQAVDRVLHKFDPGRTAATTVVGSKPLVPARSEPAL